MSDHDSLIHDAAQKLADVAAGLVEHLARETGLPHNAVVAQLFKATGVLLRGVDNRAQVWRYRVFIYAAEKPDELVADSDPELPIGEPGASVARSLAGVAEEVAMLCGLHHNCPCVGLDSTTLLWRIKSLRPTLSRKHGRATWRPPYSTLEDGEKREWIARVEIQKEDDSERT